MKKNEKTNVMRLLDNKQIVYESHFYEDTKAISGQEVASVLGGCDGRGSGHDVQDAGA